jgi:hypothetical protein
MGDTMPQNSQVFVEIGQGLFMLVGLPIISTWTTTERPQRARRGTFGFNISTNNLEYWDGAQWFETEMSQE